MPIILLLLLIPACLIIPVARTERYLYRFLTTASCLLIMVFGRGEAGLTPWQPFAALVVSLAGDYFMAHKLRHSIYYVMGILGFACAHLFHLLFILSNLKFNFGIPAAVVLLFSSYSIYLFKYVEKDIQHRSLKIASVAYVYLSCTVMSLSAGLDLPLIPKIIYILAIALIGFSDTMISERDFRCKIYGEKLVLPTYFTAHILFTAFMILY